MKALPAALADFICTTRLAAVDIKPDHGNNCMRCLLHVLLGATSTSNDMQRREDIASFGKARLGQRCGPATRQGRDPLFPASPALEMASNSHHCGPLRSDVSVARPIASALKPLLGPQRRQVATTYSTPRQTTKRCEGVPLHPAFCSGRGWDVLLACAPERKKGKARKTGNPPFQQPPSHRNTFSSLQPGLPALSSWAR